MSIIDETNPFFKKKLTHIQELVNSYFITVQKSVGGINKKGDVQYFTEQLLYSSSDYPFDYDSYWVQIMTRNRRSIFAHKDLFNLEGLDLYDLKIERKSGGYFFVYLSNDIGSNFLERL